MKTPSSWQYDEFHQVGVDYAKTEEAEAYDSRHGDFRDIEAENHAIIIALGVKAGDLLIDIGAGTGNFAIQAAKRGAKVHAIDVSTAMIAQAKSKVEQSEVANVEFHRAGFLSYQHVDQPADAIVTTFALHHLPDFWKGVALERMHEMLVPGGRLYINDVIIEQPNALENVHAMIEKLSAMGGDQLRRDLEEHFKDEYSTYDWVMDGLLTRAGFTIDHKQFKDGVLGTYLCTKRL